jgi:hypothetical protein
MAREESAREDLLAEAKQLVQRIQIVPRVTDDLDASNRLDPLPIVAGFRADGAFSIFFGEDPVYHFNADNELRRAYCQGLLIKAVGGRLISLRRHRTETETQLLRHEFSDDEQTDFLVKMREKLQQLFATINAGQLDVTGQVPAAEAVLDMVRRWLMLRPTTGWPIAARPNA